MSYYSSGRNSGTQNKDRAEGIKADQCETRKIDVVDPETGETPAELESAREKTDNSRTQSRHCAPRIKIEELDADLKGGSTHRSTTHAKTKKGLNWPGNECVPPNQSVSSWNHRFDQLQTRVQTGRTNWLMTRSQNCHQKLKAGITDEEFELGSKARSR